VSLAQEAGASDVVRKRKADDDNQMFDFKNDPRAYDMMLKQYQRNNDIRTKMIAGAEAAVVKTKGVAESKVIAAGADIKKAEAHAIRVGADGKKRLDDAEANKIEAETALLQFDLEQKRKAAGNGTRAKQSETKATNVPVVPLAIYTKINTTKPLTEQQKLNKRNKAQQVRLDAKAYRDGLGSA